MEPSAQADIRGGRDGEGRLSVFSGRRALVVGGSGGIGRAIALGLASRGASILVHGRSPGKVEDLVRAIALSGGRAEGFSYDIDGPEKFVAALEPFGFFDVLAVAFGPFVRKSLALHTSSDWERMASLNLALPGALASRYFPSMRERGFGRILFFGGTRTDAVRGFLSNAAYASAKTGLGVVTKSIALEGASRNVAAVTVCPGLVETEYLDEKTMAELRRIAPGGRLSGAADVASTALDLMDRDPCIASGAIVSLDAGFSP